MTRSLRSWLWRVPIQEEVDAELELHVEMRTRELVERGMDPKAARELAVRRLGDVAALKRTMVELGRKRERDMSVILWIEELRDDVGFAFRQLKKSPGFALVAALTLALGIGANSAIFALVDATLLRPLPFGEPARLVSIYEKTVTSPQSYVSPLNMLDWNARSATFERIAGFTPSVGGVVMAGKDGNAETIPRQWVTAGIFEVLGVKPVAGRIFLPSDEEKRANVVMMSEELWRTRFNADESIVGRAIRLDGTMYTLVGVLPKDFQLTGRSSLWVMRPFVKLPPQARAAYMLHVVGRLKPDVSMQAAEMDLTAVADGLAREFPQTNKGRGVKLEPMHDSLIGSDLRLTSMLFLGVVGFVLLICCTNVASLLLARATVRTRELAIRSALGAGRWRIVRQLLTESVVLSLFGGALGVGIGRVILGVAPSLIPPGLLPAAVTLAFDMRVVAFCAGAALFVGLLFGIAPAWQATAFSSAQVIGSDSRSATGRAGRLRGLLVAGEIATAVLLLFGAGLLLRTLVAVETFDRGYRAESVLSMLVDPLGSKYPTPELLEKFFNDVESEILAVPGVKAVAWTSSLPLGTDQYDGYAFEIVGDPPVPENQRPSTNYQVVSPAYFSALDLPIVEGRAFDERDTRDGVAVCVVNEAFSRNYFRGRSPIGQRIAIRLLASPQDPPKIREIVGVARQVKGRPDETADLVQYYGPMAQDLSDDIYLVVKPASGRADVLAPAVRAAIGRIDKEQLVSVRDVMTLDDVEAAATGRHRFRAVLVTSFAAVALLLAMVGVFGILSFSVQQRMRDFGIRRVLGATTAHVLRLVAGDAVRVMLTGAVIGLALSAVLSRFIVKMLFGVQPLDSGTFALVTIVLGVTAVVSLAGPAWRAARIDPAVVLKGK